MRILLSLILMCGVAVGMDSPEQQKRDEMLARALLEIAPPQEAKLSRHLITHLKNQNYQNWENLYELYRSSFPDDTDNDTSISPYTPNPKWSPAHNKEMEKAYYASQLKRRNTRSASDLNLARNCGEGWKNLRMRELEFAERMARERLESDERDRQWEAARQREAAQKQAKEEEKQWLAQVDKDIHVARQKKKAEEINSLPREGRVKFKNEVWFSVKEKAEYDGRYRVTLDIFNPPEDSFGGFNFFISYLSHPRYANRVYEDMELVLMLAAEELEKRGYSPTDNNVTLRARAFLPQEPLLRFGKCHFRPKDARPLYGEEWWEWMDGE